ncbi:hypothetical protein M406DRAFT_63589 [Cryphonectria parasitica EP155]|uniref:Uncharacterized protein n=1 Tax=Cryphonectria parasitica (strain ATCC 38755 / EP155) TaxID=660469 RepID=A0A9P5CL84_CRYP1|nr:uncharacterized protein M406DRAFT_63589 [Cryphonectria parasitica EP155]KAF3762798.1 hypothetical protein M406DRAFT_63589 [Cryphonectria parasitica EP155]
MSTLQQHQHHQQHQHCPYPHLPEIAPPSFNPTRSGSIALVHLVCHGSTRASEDPC